MIRFTFDKGQGSGIGRVLSIHLGRGVGYMHAWWVNLCLGPGDALKPNTPCGHRGLYHCNSIHCTRRVCRLIPSIPFVSRGATLRIWLGPTYLNWYNFRNNLRYLRRARRAAFVNSKYLYSLISFRF